MLRAAFGLLRTSLYIPRNPFRPAFADCNALWYCSVPKHHSSPREENRLNDSGMGSFDADVGITRFLTDAPGFSAILKHRREEVVAPEHVTSATIFHS